MVAMDMYRNGICLGGNSPGELPGDFILGTVIGGHPLEQGYHARVVAWRAWMPTLSDTMGYPS